MLYTSGEIFWVSTVDASCRRAPYERAFGWDLFGMGFVTGQGGDQLYIAGGTVAGTLGAAATICFLFATREGYLSIASVVTSLYPAFTVVLAATVLREHVHRAQAVGLVMCATAVALVAAG